mmetsp:Transcript_9276/g.23191  ORF Transcript_9276/g.23191 Transcript_9276/m.23191 type:complete len:489 (+) Transcript_9276:203-1669(+)
MKARSRSILARISNRITHDRRPVRVRPLPAVMPQLHVLLRVIPCPASVIHKQRRHNRRHRPHHQRPRCRLHPQQRPSRHRPHPAEHHPHYDRRQQRQQPRRDHFAQRGAGHERDAAAVFGGRGAGEDTGDFAELAPDFGDDLLGGGADGADGEGGEEEDEAGTEEAGDEDFWGGDVDDFEFGSRGEQRGYFVHVGAEEKERGGRRGAHRVALGQGLGRVAHSVEAVRDDARRRGLAGHFGNAARVVGYRAEGIHREDEGGDGQHAERRHRGAEDPSSRLVGEPRGTSKPVHSKQHGRESQDRDGGGLHSYRKTCNDVCAAPRLRSLGDAKHRAVIVISVEFCDHNEDPACSDAERPTEGKVNPSSRSLRHVKHNVAQQPHSQERHNSCNAVASLHDVQGIFTADVIPIGIPAAGRTRLGCNERRLLCTRGRADTLDSNGQDAKGRSKQTKCMNTKWKHRERRLMSLVEPARPSESCRQNHRTNVFCRN